MWQLPEHLPIEWSNRLNTTAGVTLFYNIILYYYYYILLYNNSFRRTCPSSGPTASTPPPASPSSAAPAPSGSAPTPHPPLPRLGQAPLGRQRDRRRLVVGGTRRTAVGPARPFDDRGARRARASPIVLVPERDKDPLLASFASPRALLLSSREERILDPLLARIRSSRRYPVPPSSSRPFLVPCGPPDRAGALEMRKLGGGGRRQCPAE